MQRARFIYAPHWNNGQNYEDWLDYVEPIAFYSREKCIDWIKGRGFIEEEIEKLGPSERVLYRQPKLESSWPHWSDDIYYYVHTMELR